MKTNKADKAGMSIVIPFLNEEDGIELFCAEIDKYAGELDFPIELVFVNDGSTDRSAEKLQGCRFEHIGQVQLINLSRNFGSHAATRAGITKARYDICTWMGCDLQDPLELIPVSYQKITEEGYDAVYIEKKSIGTAKANKIFSGIYSFMIKKYAVSNFSSNGINVIVFNKKIKDFLNNNIETNSSIGLQVIDAGFRTVTVPMDYHQRSAGVSKWTLAKKIKLFIDSFVAFSFAPIRMVSILGIGLFMLGILIGLYVIISKICNPAVPVGYSTTICFIVLGFGLTNLNLGIIAEYLWRAYDAARGRPCFLISETIDIQKPEDEQ